ncbi:MAG TPA: stalk domain-containing protein [Symbiobacteriaceae bacterium]|nr:stalk domain-containing protein [Symbiobacteriaceae bacterium]
MFTTDAAPFVDQGRTFVPVRYLALALGVPAENIQYAAQTRTVTLTKRDVTVQLQVESNTIMINGTPREVDAAPSLRNGRVFLPARFVSEALGYAVTFDSTAKAIIILPPGQEPEPVSAPALPTNLGQGLVTAGRSFTMVAKGDGTVVGWGDSRYGQLAEVDNHESRPSPMPIAGVPGVTGLAASSDLTAAIDTAGSVWWWGWIPDAITMNEPQKLEGLNDAKMLTAANRGFYILKADGTVWQYVFARYRPDSAMELKPIPELQGLRP